MTALLHIHGGDRDGRATFERERRASWAQALPVVLEKHGYLDVRSVDADGAAAAIAADPPAVVVVSRLAPERWTELAGDLLDGGRPLLVERPPAALRERLGIVDARPAPGEGGLCATDRGFERAVRERSGAAAAKVAGPLARPVPIGPAMLWPATAAPIATAQAEAWDAPGWSVERWSVDPATAVLAEWQPQSGRATAAIVQRGSLVALSVELLAYLAQAHSGAPYTGAEHRNWPRTLAAEAMLLELIDRLHAAAGATRLRVEPWPAGRRWALNVRHDVDRLPTRRGVAALLDRHAAAGTSATFYVRPRHLTVARAFLLRAAVRSIVGRGPGEPPATTGPRPYVGIGAPVRALRQVLARPGQELALHSEGVWNGGEVELEAFERAFGRRPAGVSSHGGTDCFRFQGAPNVLWAEAARLDYSELILHTHTLPHRFPALAADGTVAVGTTLCLPHHESFDRPELDPPTGADAILARFDLWRRSGGLLQVMSHPDLNLEELFAFLAELPREDRLDTTAADAADWWRRSHVGGELELSSERSGAAAVRSRRGVDGLVIEARAPDGARRRLDVTLAAGEGRALKLEPWTGR